MGLGFFIGGFLGDQLLGLGLGLTDQPLGLPLGLGDELIAGIHNGLRLLQLPGELVADLIQHIQDLVPLYNALIGTQRQGTCILHHIL